MIDRPSSLPNIFKAIALFTPGGDLIYGIDPNKQAQWHSDLCLGLQEKWGLADSPHFLVPGYTATVERWLDPQTQQITTIAEVHPPVERYIPLLQALFNLEPTTQWHIAPWREAACNRAVIETYKSSFPQLWEARDIILRFDPKHLLNPAQTQEEVIDDGQLATSNISNHSNGYGLHLFISGDRTSAEKTLSSIHQLLEQGLGNPYTLKVIDISKNPQQRLIHQIVATPTLIRVSPKPVKRIVGQLDDIQRVLRILTSF